MTSKKKNHIHVDNKIKSLVDFMTDKNIQHLKYEGIELTLSNEAFNSTFGANANLEAFSKQSGDSSKAKKSRDPFFGEEDDEDISEDLLFHSS